MMFDEELYHEIRGVREEVEKTGKEIARGQRRGDLGMLLEEYAETYGVDAPEDVDDWDDFKMELEYVTRRAMDLVYT